MGPKLMSWSLATIADAILESYVLPYGPLLLLSYVDSKDLGTDGTGETSSPPSSWSVGGWSWCQVRTATAVTMLKNSHKTFAKCSELRATARFDSTNEPWPVQISS